MEKIKLDSFSLYLNGKILLNNLSFSLARGESLIIIGESGSGKTLLSKLLIGSFPCSAQLTGTICYDGEEMNASKWKQVRGREIAYMTQNPMAMFNHFQTIRQHFLETIQSHNSCSIQDCEKLAISQMKGLHLGHAEQLLNKYPFELSGGMLQRVMLAMLLCLQPETVILDEPTSALDAYNRDNMIRILKQLLSEGKTLITITHDYELARELGGKMLVLSEGKIVEMGLIPEIISSPRHVHTRELLLGNPYKRLVN